MILDLTPNQVRLLDTLLGLDLEAVGLTRQEQRMAHSIHMKLVEKRAASTPAPGERDPLRILRLTPSYRHSDK